MTELLKMKVLVFTSLYPNNVRHHQGVFVKERMTWFAKSQGHQVKVVAPVPYFPPIRINHRWRYSQILQQETIDGLEVYHPRYFMTPKIGMLLYGLTMFLSVLPIMTKIRRNFDFDLIDSHFVYPDGFAAVLLGRFFKKPVVVSARGSDINLYRDLPVIRRFLQYTLRRADKVIAVCQALKNAMEQLGIPSEKIVVVPNGVDTEKFYPVPKREARRKLDLRKKKIILSVGGLVTRKGFDLLIKAFKILSDKFQEEDLHLVIIGEGEARGELERLTASLKLNDRVRLVGDVAHQSLYLWYSAADLFCLASSREGWPNVILEALACGTPVVATDVWGVPEIIQSETVGLLTTRSELGIANGLALALAKPWHSEAIVQYAQQHTWENAARTVSQVFQAVLEK